MTTTPDSDDDMTDCPVCFEDYEETGEHVPRLLPCTHTVCEKCTRELLKGGDSLICPECRTKHVANNTGFKTFPQNKYILKYLNRKRKRARLEYCGKHNRELGLYCAEALCAERICSVCLSQDHRCHNVIDVQVREQVQILEEINKNNRQLKCSETLSIATDYKQIRLISLVGQSTLAVCATVNGQCKLFTHNLQRGGESFRVYTKLEEVPCGMTGLTLGNRLCVALSYTTRRNIQFRDVGTLNCLTPCLSAMATGICSVAPSTLYYLDHSSKPWSIRWVDLSQTRVKAGATSVGTHRKPLVDMCFAEYEEKQLVVLANCYLKSELDSPGKILKLNENYVINEINAYDVKSGELVWNVECSLPGVEQEIHARGITTDGRGHLFVCDINNRCVQMFSTGGVYLEPVLREGEHGLGQPWRIRWCGTSQSLIIAHVKNHTWNISVFNVKLTRYNSGIGPGFLGTWLGESA